MIMMVLCILKFYLKRKRLHVFLNHLRKLIVWGTELQENKTALMSFFLPKPLIFWVSISELKENYCRWYKVLLLNTLFLSPQIPNAVCKLLCLFGSYHCRDQVRKALNTFKPLGFTKCFLKLLFMMHVCFLSSTDVCINGICKWKVQRKKGEAFSAH